MPVLNASPAPLSCAELADWMQRIAIRKNWSEADLIRNIATMIDSFSGLPISNRSAVFVLEQIAADT
jgi:hypothetical protein